MLRELVIFVLALTLTITYCLRTQFRDFVISIAYMIFRGPEWEGVTLRQLRNIYHIH